MNNNNNNNNGDDVIMMMGGEASTASIETVVQQQQPTRKRVVVVSKEKKMSLSTTTTTRKRNNGRRKKGGYERTTIMNHDDEEEEINFDNDERRNVGEQEHGEGGSERSSNKTRSRQKEEDDDDVFGPSTWENNNHHYSFNNNQQQGGGSEAGGEGEFKRRTKQALHDFFYPPEDGITMSSGCEPSQEAAQCAEENRLFVEQFWKYYDDIIILSLFTQLGILFRLAAAGWFRYFDDTFRHDSALFVNLPLNSLSTFFLGLFSSGEDIMSIVETRFTPQQRQTELQENGNNNEEEEDENNPHLSSRLKRLRRRKRNRLYKPVRITDLELRQVQLLAYERRIRASKSLVLFPAKPEEIDLMEHYFTDGYQKNNNNNDNPQLDNNRLSSLHSSPLASSPPRHQHARDWSLQTPPSSSSLHHHQHQDNDNVTTHEDDDDDDDDDDDEDEEQQQVESTKIATQQHNDNNKNKKKKNDETLDYGTEYDKDLDQMIYDVGSQFTLHVKDEFRNLSSNLNQLSKVTLANGWDVGTSADEMSDDLMLGLRDGFCGALSSFSSWNSSMVALIKQGRIGTAIVGYTLGIQLPIISFRFGQHVAAYIFVWKCRQAKRKEERRGYGIKLSNNCDDEQEQRPHEQDDDASGGEMPSIRAIATAIFFLSAVAQLTSLFFYNDAADQQLALSLLFSPLGVLARWRLSKYNAIRPGFPLGTFCCNLLACALSGSLGSLLAGNPGPRERIVLVGIISGFGGTLSSVAAFCTEIIHGLDPILFRYDGILYAGSTILWGMIIGLVSSSSVDWADRAGN